MLHTDRRSNEYMLEKRAGMQKLDKSVMKNHMHTHTRAWMYEEEKEVTQIRAKKQS